LRVVQVKCPKCSYPIKLKQRDRLFYCDNCGTIHVIREDGVNIIDYDIADFNPAAGANRFYVPFWRLKCSFTIHHRSVSGGYVFKLSSWIKNEGGSGELFVYIPASEFDSQTFRRLATNFTTNPPGYRTRSDFDAATRVPATMTREEAAELADFVIVTIEAEKPGVLQGLNYTLSVNEYRLIYMPFIIDQSGMYPAL